MKDARPSTGRKKGATWDCGVPKDQCAGTGFATPHQTFKGHGSREEATACAKRYARKRNAEAPIGSPMFLPSTPQRLKPGKGGRTMAPRMRG